MEKNCSKYEGLFVFSDEKTLNEHLAECSYCRAEHEKMQKVSVIPIFFTGAKIADLAPITILASPETILFHSSNLSPAPSAL